MTDQKGVLVKHHLVRAFGNDNDKFKCRVFDAVYAEVSELMLNTAHYEEMDTAQRAFYLDNLRDVGFQSAVDIAAKLETGEADPEGAPPTVVRRVWFLLLQGNLE